MWIKGENDKTSLVMDTEREDIAVLFKYFYFKNCLKEKLKILITELTTILERNNETDIF